MYNTGRADERIIYDDGSLSAHQPRICHRAHRSPADAIEPGQYRERRYTTTNTARFSPHRVLLLLLIYLKCGRFISFLRFLISFLISFFSVDFFKFSAAVATNPLAEHLRLRMRLMRLDQIIFSRKTEIKKEKKNKKK
jgi:hypothetical protein